MSRRAERRAAEKFGRQRDLPGALPASKVLLSKSWHRKADKQRVLLGFDELAYAQLTLDEAWEIARQLDTLSQASTRAPA